MKKCNIILFAVLALLLTVSLAHAEQAVIRILYINDFHGYAEPYKPVGSNEKLGGAAYLASTVEVLRKEKPSLLLAAGDMISGNIWANFFQGKSVIELMDAMRFDAMVIGNHEFDYGQEVLKKRIAESSFPVLGANVEGLNLLKPYVIKSIGGIKAAIIGVVTDDTPVTTHPKNVAGLKFLPVEDTVRKYINELHGDADIFIVLSHIGYFNDRILAQKVKGIDVIVGGHSHTKIQEPQVIGNTIIVQAWEYGKALGVLDLTVEDHKIVHFDGHLEEIKLKKGKEDKNIKAIVEKYNRKAGTALNQKIGETLVDLDGENARTRETNLGDFIADIIRNVSGADVSIINGGSIRAGIKKGKIRVKDIYNALPFDNYVVAIKLSGRQILDALEHGVSAVEKAEGRFPQVSGIKFTFSLSAKPGSRIKEVLIAGKPIDLKKEYVVATNDFLAAGGDGYKVFSIAGGTMKGEKLVYNDSGRRLRDVVGEYIKKKKKIAPQVEGRITEIDMYIASPHLQSGVRGRFY